MKLYVGYESTWSLRAWICAQIAEVELEIEVLPLSGAGYKPRLVATTNTGLVPALQSGDIFISDSLAIAEYLNEISVGKLYPETLTARSHARSLVCELHSGFFKLRAGLPFSSKEVSPVTLNNEMETEIGRVKEIFVQAKTRFMFDGPTIVDAFYSVLAYRLKAYGIYLDGAAGDYQNSLLDWPLLRQALDKNKDWS